MMNVFANMKPYFELLLLLGAIVTGGISGIFYNIKPSFVDYSIIAMLFFLFYGISLDGLKNGIKNKRYISIALISNFIIIPILAFFLTRLFVNPINPIFIGLIIYMVAPCTDWYLGFTKIANGDVEANTALLPYNLLFQVILLPVFLYLFTNNSIHIPNEIFLDALIYWIMIPFGAAQVFRFVIGKTHKKTFLRSTNLAEQGHLLSLLLLVFSLFNTNIELLIIDSYSLPLILSIIFIFFIINFILNKLISKSISLSNKEETSLTMTTAARNAPLMLVISLLLFPNQTIIQLVLIAGMLLEIPLLVTITYFAQRQIIA